jgi:hypothetical protein
MKVVLVAESLGKNEALVGHPLVGWSGRELAKMLGSSNLAPELRVPYPSLEDMISHWKWLKDEHQIAVTNVFNEHPEGDKTELFFATQGNIDTSLPPIKINNRIFYVKSEYRYHIENLWKEIENHNPNVIVALGNYACWALLGITNISSIRGTPKLSLRFNKKVFPTFHPAALRQEQLRTDIISDLQKVAYESNFPEIRRIKRWITCEDPKTKEKITLSEIKTWLAQPAESYTIDIETGYALFSRSEIKNMPVPMRRILSELISMVSFARSPYESLVIPFMTREDPELNYWKSLEEEIQAWELLIGALRSPVPKAFQNGIFDISHFLRIGIIVNNCADDPMILQHATLPEKRRGLGYLASIYSNEIAWKSMLAHGESLKREE